jgi:hypothetical protein
MRQILAFLLLFPISAAVAQPAEERAYLDLRDAAVATVRAKGTDPDYQYDGAKYKQLTLALEMRLRRIIGSISPPKGFAGTGKISPDQLCCGLGEGELDGIAFSNREDRVIVTTESLLLAWLRQHRDWWKDEPPMPDDPQMAFRSDAFYTQAISTDTHVDVFAPLPVAQPAGAKTAVAQLVLLSQAGALWPPKEIAAGVIKGGRAYVAVVRATIRPASIVACDAVLKELQAKVEAAFAENKADNAMRLELERDSAFKKCWAERVKDEPAFPAIVSQAQALVQSLAAE